MKTSIGALWVSLKQKLLLHRHKYMLQRTFYASKAQN